MGAVRTDEGSTPGKGSLIAASIFGAVLLIALIWSLSRALNNSSPHGSVAPTNAATVMDAVSSQEEIERQHEMAEQRTAPVIQTPAAVQPAGVPAVPKVDEVRLQKAKAKVNRRIVERMKQYVKDNPVRDNRELEEQIKRRENRGSQSQ